MIDIEKIKQAALAATQGEWVVDDDEDSDYFLVGPHDGDYLVYQPVVKLHDERNANHIAAANPSAVLELIDRLEAAEQDAEYFRLLRDSMTFMDVDHNYVMDGEPNVPVLASVSNRIWYHATDDNHSCTVEQLCEAMKESK